MNIYICTVNEFICRMNPFIVKSNLFRLHIIICICIRYYLMGLISYIYIYIMMREYSDKNPFQGQKYWAIYQWTTASDIPCLWPLFSMKLPVAVIIWSWWTWNYASHGHVPLARRVRTGKRPRRASESWHDSGKLQIVTVPKWNWYDLQ